MLDTLDIGASALFAQRVRMDTIAQNVANMNTTRNASGELEPYRRRFVVFSEGRPDQPESPGVRVTEIGLDDSPFREVFDPGHSDAGPDGIVRYPNVDLAMEMVNMMSASRSYEANVTLMETTKAMVNASMRLLA